MSTQIRDSYIVAAVRTPVGKAPRGVLRYTRPDDMLAFVIKGALAKVPSLDPVLVEDVIVGCAMPEGAQGMNVARIGLLLAGLPASVPGMTVNRFCSSGLQTIALAADRIATGQADVIIAGGTESMSMVPLGGKSMSANPAYFASQDEHVAIAYGMGITAENVAKRWQITREQQDEFAFESHRRALNAQKNHWFEEILPYTVENKKPDLVKGVVTTKEQVVTNDEGPRADTSLEALSKLRPVFSAKGTVTAGNSSQTSDGAAALVLVSEEVLKRYNLVPIASLRSYAVAGVPPEIMGIGPSFAIPKALKRANLTVNDIEWIELNEAFAAQALAVMKETNLPHDKLNPVGGAIALGHPLGATGAIRAATIINGMRREKKKYGMVTMCIGTGMGAAGVIEVF